MRSEALAIPFNRPTQTPKVDTYVSDALRSRRLSGNGPKTALLSFPGVS